MYYALSASEVDLADISRLCAHIARQLAGVDESSRAPAPCGLRYISVPGSSGGARFSVLYPNRSDLSELFIGPAEHKLASAVRKQDAISLSYLRKFCPEFDLSIPSEASVGESIDCSGNLRDLVALLERVETQWRRLCRYASILFPVCVCVWMPAND